MGELPFEVRIQLYSFDPTYKDIGDKVLISSEVHCLIYRCDRCCRHYNDCYCYCETCRTFLRFCKQMDFDSKSMTEYDFEDIAPMTD